MKSFVESLEERRLLSTYYVDTDAGPSGNGSLAYPWNSIQQVNAYAANTGFQFGDHIRFHGGQTFDGNLILSQNGTRANPIVVNSYARATGNATIDAGNGSGITGHNISGIIIANLTITGTSQAAPEADAAELADAASAGAQSITVTNSAGLTPGAQLDIGRFTDGASTHFYEEAYVAWNYVAGSTTVPLQSPLVFAHAAGAAVNWDVNYGIGFIADDGNQHPRGFTLRGVKVAGISGVWPSAGIAFLGDGVKNGEGIDPVSGSHIAYSPGDSGFQAVVIRDDLVTKDGPTGILFGGNTFSGATDLNEYSDTNLRIVHDIVRRSGFSNQTIADASAAMEGPLHPQDGESGILIYDSQAVLINQVQSLYNGEFGNGGAGVLTYRSDGVVIAHAESAFNSTAGASGGYGFDLDEGVTNSIVEYSYSHDNAGAGLAMTEESEFNGAAPANSANAYRYNVSQNDARENGSGAISVANTLAAADLAGDDIYGNTAYVSPVASGTQPVVVSVSGLPSGMFLFDNIFYAVSASGTPVEMASVSASSSVARTNVRFLRNDYWAVDASAGDMLVTYNSVAYMSLATWEQQTKQEMENGSATGLTLDPMLNAAGQGGTLGDGDPLDAGIFTALTEYQIASDSGLIGLGVDPATLGIDAGGSDFYGNLLPPADGYALGADQG